MVALPSLERTPGVARFDVKLSTIILFALAVIVCEPLGSVIVKVLSGSPVMKNPLGSAVPVQDRFGPQLMLPSGLTIIVPRLPAWGTINAKARSALLEIAIGVMMLAVATAVLSPARADKNHPAEKPIMRIAPTAKCAKDRLMAATF